MKVYKLELYRAFHSRTFAASIVIGIAICALDLITFCIQFGVGGNKYLIQAWIGTDYQFIYNDMFYLLLPVIACLPYGGSLYYDIKIGYDKNICIKVPRSKYAFAKSLAVFLSGFVSVALPLALNVFFASGLFPNYLPERLEFMSIGLLERHLFTIICNYHPALYCLLFILIDGIFAGAIALTSLSLSRIVKSHFMAVATPMIIYIISGALMMGNDEGNWGIDSMINPNPVVTTLWYQMVIAFILVLSVNSLSIWIQTRKRDIL